MAALGTIAALLVSGRPRQFVWALIVLVAALAAFADGQAWNASLGRVAVGLLGTAAPALLGTYIVSRRQPVQALIDRAEQAPAEERSRMASEMHDVVTHRVTLMVLQAGALQVTTTDSTARHAAEDLRAQGGAALEELRDVVSLLGAEQADGNRDAERYPRPQDGDDLSIMAAETESVGVPVDLTITGDPSHISPLVMRTAHRVVEESLSKSASTPREPTLASKWSAPPAGFVSRSATPPRPGRGTPDRRRAARASASSGCASGSEVVGGVFDAGPCDDGGFAVHVWLPAFVASRPSDQPTDQPAGQPARPHARHQAGSPR